MDLYSGKSCIILALCLSLYVLLSSLLLFYIEECTADHLDIPSKDTKTLENVKKDCIIALEKAFRKSSKDVNGSADYCDEIVAKIYGAHLSKQKDTKCDFNTKTYFPWLHTVTLSLLTIGGGQIPISLGGKALLMLIIMAGIFPTIRFFMQCGIRMHHLIETAILCFEVKILNRSSRMIHTISLKVMFIQSLIIITYNLVVAKITSLQFYRTQWTYSDSVLFWLSGMTTTGQKLDVIQDDEFYSNGGWRILCLDTMMIVNMILVSGLLCAIVQRVHKAICPAAATIRNAFKTQNPEVYLQIRPLKSHL